MIAPKPTSDFKKLKNRSYSTASLHNNKIMYIVDKSDIMQPVVKHDIDDVDADTRLIGFGSIVESPKARRFTAQKMINNNPVQISYMKDVDSDRSPWAAFSSSFASLSKDTPLPEIL